MIKCPAIERVPPSSDPHRLESVAAGWWLGLERVVPPPLGAFADRSAVGRYRGWGFRRWTGQRGIAQWSALAVGDDEGVGGSGDGDDAAVVQPVVVWTYQHQVVQLGFAAVLPMPDVMGVQTTGRPTAGHRTGGVAMFQRAAQSPVDHSGAAA